MSYRGSKEDTVNWYLEKAEQKRSQKSKTLTFDT